MSEPAQNRDLGSLAPVLLYPFLAWRAAVLDQLPHITIEAHETRRTYERQLWLYRQGRIEPYLDKPVVTWTLDSLHRWGLGVDWHFVRKSQPGVAVWDTASYEYIYRLVPPGMFGLKCLPGDLVHLEPVFARQMTAAPGSFGLYLA